jgi:pimeloyl-ACP methyl ester carboxylesterase
MLLIAGADDKTVPMKGCEEIFSQYATGKTSKTLKIIEGVGHWHCIEASEEVARLINDFVSEK